MRSQAPFDIQRKAAAKTSPAKKPVKSSKPKRTREPKVRRRTSLRDKREAARARARMMLLIILVLVVAVGIYGLWQPAVRITNITAAGVPEGAVTLAKQELAGSYLHIIPRDSIFFYPEKQLAAAIIEEYPEITSFNISRASFSSLVLHGARRVTAFYWCGESASDFTTTLADCFEADENGLVFAKSTGVDTATSSDSALRIYAPLDTASSTGAYPLRGRVIGSEHMPQLLTFERIVEAQSVPVLSAAITKDEATLFVTPETRILYVLGHEESAEKLAIAAFPTLNLLDGSIEYVDLRFDGKVYLKRRKE